MGFLDWFAEQERRPGNAAHSEACARFVQSTCIGYHEWHDGIGYDLDALRAMTPLEQEEAVAGLRCQEQGWREVEVYHALATPAAISALHDALRCASADTRLHAADRLHELGLMPTLDEIVARELQQVTIGDGMVTALRIAARFPTEEVREALLASARRRPEVGIHYAAMLCYLTGKAKSDFDWSMRLFFLRFGEHSSYEDREAAFVELCEMTGMSDTSTE